MLYNSAVKKGSLLRRYNRLLSRYNTHRHEVSLAQIADTLACTARYARSLLHEMQGLAGVEPASGVLYVFDFNI
ncbi:SgrR family transcriptional regulator [Kosakonia pseudosacchari]|uniref:SgrR family transcriptional regulator n=1 Tax=Kosakonia pseudosacchari TaxID=1646340 RepID=UPI0020D03449|nr:SgrR family transcriptional regulator [Kosakonia pseudosacchari]